MGSLQNRFDLREEKKVTRGQIGGIWEVFQSCNVFFCEKLTNTQGCVSRSVIVMERSCVGFPKARHALILRGAEESLHFEFLPQSQTVNQTVYKERYWLRRRSSKRSQKMSSKNVLNRGKGECTSVFKWKGITLRNLTLVYFNIFQ